MEGDLNSLPSRLLARRGRTRSERSVICVAILFPPPLPSLLVILYLSFGRCFCFNSPPFLLPMKKQTFSIPSSSFLPLRWIRKTTTPKRPRGPTLPPPLFPSRDDGGGGGDPGVARVTVTKSFAPPRTAAAELQHLAPRLLYVYSTRGEWGTPFLPYYRVYVKGASPLP